MTLEFINDTCFLVCSVWAGDPQGADGARKADRVDPEEGAPGETGPHQAGGGGQEAPGEESRPQRWVPQYTHTRTHTHTHTRKRLQSGICPFWM